MTILDKGHRVEFYANNVQNYKHKSRQVWEFKSYFISEVVNQQANQEPVIHKKYIPHRPYGLRRQKERPHRQSSAL